MDGNRKTIDIINKYIKLYRVLKVRSAVEKCKVG